MDVFSAWDSLLRILLIYLITLAEMYRLRILVYYLPPKQELYYEHQFDKRVDWFLKEHYLPFFHIHLMAKNL